MFKSFNEFNMMGQVDGDCGSFEVSATISIQESYFGTDVDDVPEFHPMKIEELDIKEIIFTSSDKSERKLTRAEINEVYDSVREYVSEKIEDFLDEGEVQNER